MGLVKTEDNFLSDLLKRPKEILCIHSRRKKKRQNDGKWQEPELHIEDKLFRIVLDCIKNTDSKKSITPWQQSYHFKSIGILERRKGIELSPE